MSISNITFLSQFISYNLFVFTNPNFNFLYFTDIIEVKLFLETLEIDKTYVVTFELVISEILDDDNDPVITLSKPILITKLSNPTLISKFLLNQINLADNQIGLDLDLIMQMRLNEKTTPYILVKYNEINLF